MSSLAPWSGDLIEPSVNRGRLLIVGAVSLVVFLVLTGVVVATGGVDAADSALTRAVIGLRSPVATTAADLATRLGSFPSVVVIALVAAAVLRGLTRRWLSSGILLTSVALTAGVVYLVKIAVGRARPGTGTLLGTPSPDYAFPSGHTTDGGVVIMLSAALIALALHSPRARRVVVATGAALAICIGISRVYLGYHWATDVLGGWALASTVVCIAVSLALAVRGTVAREVAEVSSSDIIALPSAPEDS